jgi:hypothetical protein
MNEDRKRNWKDHGPKILAFYVGWRSTLLVPRVIHNVG